MTTKRKNDLKLANLKAGDTVLMADNNYNAYGYQIDDEVKITSLIGNNIQVIGGTNNQNIGVSIFNIKLANISRERIEAKIAELGEEIKIQKDKIAYLDETKEKVFDVTEFKVWRTLKTLSTNSTDLEKAKAIAKLIKG